MGGPSGQTGWERLFWLVFERSSHPIVLLDGERRIVDANDAAAALWGGTRRELAGRSMVDSIDPSERQVATREWQAFLRSGDYSDALLECVDVPVLACAVDCRLTYANPAARELIGGDCALGTRPDVWIKRLRPRMPSGIPMPREDLPPVRALAGEVVSGVVVRIREREAMLEVAARPAIDHRGRLRGAVVRLDDVTDVRTREAMLPAEPS
jgi:PAS domain-containing protein